MNFLELVNKIKEKNIGKICMVKSGIFYYALNGDALVMEKYCNLDKICFSTNVCKIGFPLNSLEKYMNMLKCNNISFCVYGFSDKNDFIDEEIFKYKDKIYGKIYEFYYNDVDYTMLNKDCYNCKFYEREIIRNVSRLTDAVNRYLEEIEKFNDYKCRENKEYTSCAGSCNEG